ncbi:MAG TPA: fibronectin type III domain-containing protein [Planctomycetota bacterium]
MGRVRLLGAILTLGLVPACGDDSSSGSVDTTPPGAVASLTAANPTETTMELSWLAPGDDGASGTATSYDVRYSAAAITDANWAAATPAVGEPTPALAGTLQGFTVTGLTRETTYHFALRATDDQGLESALSNIPSAATLDLTPPAAVADLTVGTVAAETVALSWTSPGDDGAAGTAASFDVRYASAPISDATWAAATPAAGEPTPAVAGTVQGFTVTGLSSGTSYHFALRAIDNAGLESALSNVPTATTSHLFVVIRSAASNLDALDTNFSQDLFLRDATSGTTALISLGAGNLSLNGDCYAPCLSADGRWIAFSSLASNAAAGDVNSTYDVFLIERLTGALSLVSGTAGGVPGNGSSEDPSISADGRYIAFYSFASDIGGGSNFGLAQVFIRDRILGTTTLVSLNALGQKLNSHARYPSLSGTGTVVAFESAATNVPGKTFGTDDVFVKNVSTGAIEIASVSTAGVIGAGSSRNPSLSADGTLVVFVSDAENLVGDDNNGARDVFVRDRSAGTTVRVSVATGNVQANAASDKPVISADGRFVAFSSTANNLVAGDTNGFEDVFVHDRVTGMTTRASVATDGTQGNLFSFPGGFSPDGRYLTFSSAASNLVAGDSNAATDAFLRDRQAGTTTRLSVTSGGVQGNASSFAETGTAP